MVHVVRDAVFYENVFPFRKNTVSYLPICTELPTTAEYNNRGDTTNSTNTDENDFQPLIPAPEPEIEGMAYPPENNQPAADLPMFLGDEQLDLNKPGDKQLDLNKPEGKPNQEIPTGKKTLGKKRPIGTPVRTNVRTSKRIRKQPTCFKNYVLCFLSVTPVDARSFEVVPTTFEAAINGPEREQWILAMREEIRSITKNNTWKLVCPPPDANIVGSKWVFEKKKKK